MAEVFKKKDRKIIFLVLGLLVISYFFLVWLFYARFISKDSIFKTNQILNKDCERNIVCTECNIVLISVDSLRADHVQTFGYERKTTPFFDQLSKKSALFMNYFSTSYLTPISEMSLHTGMYPSSNRLVNFGSTLPPNKETLAQFLKKQGYTTVAMHSSPEFFNYPSLKQSFERGFDKYQKLDYRKITKKNKDTVKNEIERLKSNKFFFWITLGNVHWPYNNKYPNIYADPNYKGVFKDKTLDWSTLANVFDGVYYPDKELLKDEDIKYIIDNYDNSIRVFDDFLKEFMNNLSRNNLLKNTIIVIVSEHGEDFGEHGYISHYDIYDTQIHTPFLIFSPKINTSQKIYDLTSSVDIFPTVASLIGTVSPINTQGKNLLSKICKTNSSEEDVVYIERIPLWEQVVQDGRKNITDKGMNPDLTKSDIAIRTKEWKYILRNSKSYLEKISWWSNLTGKPIPIENEELYHLTVDPNELDNVASKHPKIVEGLNRKLVDWYNTISNRPKQNNITPVIQEYF